MKENWQLIENEKEGTSGETTDILEKVLLNRGIDLSQRKSFLFPDYEKDLHDPFLLKDMAKAVDRVLKAKEAKEKICIYGDYDADGVTSTTLLSDFFKQIGLDFFCYIPDKDKEGNSLNKQAIDYIHSEEAGLIITVDCGVSSYEEVVHAKEKGVEVIITDHHSLPAELSPAVAVVNPKVESDYPEKNLAGVGVAFKFVSALATKIEGYDLEQLKWLLDLVAIGTIADCVPLVGENRVLAKYGLLVLSKTKRVGLKQIFQVGSLKINSSNIPSAEQISFQLAPRINAAGRIDHANLAFNLLAATEEEYSQARMLALELENKNQRRQKVTARIMQEVEKRLKEKEQIPAVIIESAPHWGYGIVGLVAGKIADKYHRPTLILQEKEGVLRGSGRSVPEVNFIEVLRKFGDLMGKYGGHAQALGGELPKENIEKLRAGLEEAIAPLLKEKTRQIMIDAKIKLPQINFELIDQLEQLEPFGEGNREPVFLAEKLTLSETRLVGNGEKHLKLVFKEGDSEKDLQAIGFGLAEEHAGLQVGDQVNVVFVLQKNHWNGSQSIQARVIDLEKI